MGPGSHCEFQLLFAWPQCLRHTRGSGPAKFPVKASTQTVLEHTRSLEVVGRAWRVSINWEGMGPLQRLWPRASFRSRLQPTRSHLRYDLTVAQRLCCTREAERHEGLMKVARVLATKCDGVQHEDDTTAKP